jgi:hypothetical protein
MMRLWTSGQARFASSVISALRTLETGQFFSASFASSANFVSSRLGTFARSVKAERLILNPIPSGSRVTAAFRAELGRGKARSLQAKRERHRETPGVRRGD